MLKKAYNAANVEDDIYKLWEDSGAFIADVNSNKPPFTIAMPPPNATGQLHLGHAVMLALEDIFTRFARMNGKEALWIPGTDHASIATESRVIKKLQEEGMKDPREELGREGLLKEIASFVEGSRGTIRGQVRKMGSSCDWSRERYTMDPMLNRCVNEVFTSMFNDGLLYRGNRSVNWDPNLQTTVSDDEVEHKEVKDPFYTFKYGPFEIGTVRPETKFADKIIVVHPDDERYSQYEHRQTFEVEWINGPITATLIKDEAADPEMGTGAMTITPWHSAIDFDLAKKHDLAIEQIIDWDGKLLEIADEFAGMHIKKARPLIVEKLQAKGLVVSINEDYVHSVALNSRGKGIIEPQVKEQWFIDVNKPVVEWKNADMSLKEIMQDVIRSGDIEIVPNRFEKTYFAWIDNLRDWCVSRQIWWGHRVPAWYSNGKIKVQADSPGEGWIQDNDTLDTWFSSALWTWSTLIDPALMNSPELTLKQLLEQSPDFQKFHPTQVMETGYDIIFFWVARMILMTTYATKQIPFKTVYLHGMVRTKDGAKMSKSKPKTMINPLEVIPEFGADALRLSMIVGQTPGNDMRIDQEKIAGYRNFINKLWNASRFVLMQCEQAEVDPRNIAALQGDNSNLSLADKAILIELDRLITDVTSGVESYRLSEVGERLYSFVWEEFCDWYLELSKGSANITVLLHVLRTILTLLHPYCPFVTEEIWKMVSQEGSELLIKTPWPTSNVILSGDEGGTAEYQVLKEVISAIRKVKAEQNIPPSEKPSITIVSPMYKKVIQEESVHIVRMGRVTEVQLSDKFTPEKTDYSVFLKNVEVHVHLGDLIDPEAETAALNAEKENLEKYIKSVEGKLSNKQFVANAPEAVVARERAKMQEAQDKLGKILERLQS